MLEIQRRASLRKNKTTGYFKRGEVTLYQQPPPYDKTHILKHHTLECIGEEEEKEKRNQTSH